MTAVQVYNTTDHIWIKYDKETGKFLGDQHSAYANIPKVRSFSIRNFSRNKRKVTHRIK